MNGVRELWQIGLLGAPCARKRPHPGAQLTFTDVDGHRITALLTNTAPSLRNLPCQGLRGESPDAPISTQAPLWGGHGDNASAAWPACRARNAASDSRAR